MFAPEDILYEDNHLLIVNKRCGDLVQPDPSGESALEDQIKAFVKRRDAKPGDVFLGVVLQSAGYIDRLLADYTPGSLPAPDYAAPPAPDSLAFGLVEGWRGETCHVLLTDAQGRIAACRIKDPSLHNWLALALAVRGEGISDFPICNKSFNLSYCGHDL